MVETCTKIFVVIILSVKTKVTAVPKKDLVTALVYLSKLSH